MISDPCQVTLNTQRGCLLSNYLFYNQYLIYLYSNNAIIIFKLFLPLFQWNGYYMPFGKWPFLLTGSWLRGVCDNH